MIRETSSISNHLQAIIDLAAQRTVSRQISFEQIGPLAKHHRLAAGFASVLPESSDAGQYSAQAAVRELQLARLQTNLCDSLTKHGFRVWPYKGPSLARRLGASYSRESQDVDILVHPENFLAASKIVSVGRFRVGPPVESIDSKFAEERDLTFLQEKPNAKIEVHWKMFRSYFGYKLDDLLWKELEVRGEVGDDLLFCILAHHGGLHGMFRLRWSADLIRLGQRELNTVTGAREIAASSGSLVLFDAVLCFLSKLLGIEFDVPVSSRGSQRLARKWIEFIASEVMEEPPVDLLRTTIVAACPGMAKFSFLTSRLLIPVARLTG